jgi:D-alanyl-D-alanine carboxypeptidase
MKAGGVDRGRHGVARWDMSNVRFQSYWIGEDGEGSEGEADRVLPLWSFTKTVMAIVALHLVEQGLVDLDAPLPGAAYCLRDLLCHTEGLPDYGSNAAHQAAVARGDSAWPMERLLTEIPPAPRHAPGEGWGYSNIGYRNRMEALSGCSMAALMVDLITRPLGGAVCAICNKRCGFRRHGADCRRSV